MKVRRITHTHTHRGIRCRSEKMKRPEKEGGAAANCNDPREKCYFNASFTGIDTLHLDAHLALSYSASVPMIWSLSFAYKRASLCHKYSPLQLCCRSISPQGLSLLFGGIELISPRNVCVWGREINESTADTPLPEFC